MHPLRARVLSLARTSLALPVSLFVAAIARKQARDAAAELRRQQAAAQQNGEKGATQSAADAAANVAETASDEAADALAAADGEEEEHTPEEDTQLNEDLDKLDEAQIPQLTALFAPDGTPCINATTVNVVSWLNGSSAKQLTLDPSVFGVPIRRHVVHDVIRWQLAKRRKGNAKVKTLSEMRGSGRKVRRQKGTGMARAGHRFPPQWRGGYKPHGPRPRDFSFKLTKKFRKLGLRIALSARLLEGQLMVVDELASDAYKTRSVEQTMKERGIEETVLFITGDVLDDGREKFKRSTANIASTKVIPAKGANVYDIIKRKSVVLSEDAVELLQTRLHAD